MLKGSKKCSPGLIYQRLNVKVFQVYTLGIWHRLQTSLSHRFTEPQQQKHHTMSAFTRQSNPNADHYKKVINQNHHNPNKNSKPANQQIKGKSLSREKAVTINVSPQRTGTVRSWSCLLPNQESFKLSLYELYII